MNEAAGLVNWGYTLICLGVSGLLMVVTRVQIATPN